MFMLPISLWAQQITPLCRTCGKKISECQYKGRHPAKKVDSGSKRNNKPAKVHCQSSAPKPVQFPDGVYTGKLVNGVRQGAGTFKYNNGDFYDGYWENNVRQGYGICKFKNGDMYDGYWNNDTYEGMGTYFYANGNQLHGEWKDGSINGKGECRMADGTYYEGSLKDNRPNGGGCLISAGDTIVGIFKDFIVDGYSYKRTKEGNRIMSMSKDGVPNGFYILGKPDGIVSYFYMKDGIEDGPAIILKPDRTICGLVYNNGKVVSSKTYTRHSLYKKVYYDLGTPDLSNIRPKQTGTKFGVIPWISSAYIGDIRNGVPHGFGIMVWYDNTAYVGFFADGKRDGQGANITFENGCCNYGSWNKGKENGVLTIFWTHTSQIEKRTFKDGVRVQ